MNMKTLFKPIIGLVSLFVCVSVEASVLVATPTAGEIQLLSSTGVKVSQVTVAAGSGATAIVEFFDHNATNAANYYGTGYLVSAYTTKVYVSSNVVNNYVTTTGVTNFMTNTLLYAIASNVPASTNALPALVTLAVPVSQSISFAVDSIFARGLVMRVNTNATVIVQYTAAP